MRRRTLLVGANGWYWPAKIQGNGDQDTDTNCRLNEAGWIVVRIWQHEPQTRRR